MLRKLAFILAFYLLLGSVPVMGAEAIYINTEEELIALSRRVSEGDSMKGVSVYLAESITLTAPFTPIGNSADTPFSGSFYGGGNTVKGLKVQGGDYNGLFGCITGGSVYDLKLENVNITGGNYCGAVVGRLYCFEGYSTISGCTVTGTVEGESYTGGIVGLAFSAAHGIYGECLIKECSFTGSVKGDMYVGGTVGRAEAISTSSRAESRIENCKTYGNVVANGRYGSMAGGVCGALSAKSDGGSSIARIEGSVSYSNVGAEMVAAGGVCGVTGADGYGAASSVKNSVALGSVSSRTVTGGVTGQCEQTNKGVSTVSGCVAGASLFGSDLYTIAKGDGVSDCYTAEDEKIVYPVEVTVPIYIKGDTDGDGYADNTDALAVLKYDAGLALLGIPSKLSADVNGDGCGDNTDALLILKYDAGIIEGL